MTKLIVLDRDGVINKDSISYIKSVDEFILIPESVEAIVQLSQAGYTVAVATNQSGVSRGLYTEDALQAIHQKMTAAILSAGGRIDVIEHCIHLPESHCLCRKPEPGMLHAIAKRFNCSLQGVPFVGDRVSDIQAALAVDAQAVLVLSSMTDVKALQAYPEVPVYSSLANYVKTLFSAS